MEKKYADKYLEIYSLIVKLEEIAVIDFNTNDEMKNHFLKFRDILQKCLNEMDLISQSYDKTKGERK